MKRYFHLCLPFDERRPEAKKSQPEDKFYASLALIGLVAHPSLPDWGGTLYEYRVFIFDDAMLILWPSSTEPATDQSSGQRPSVEIVMADLADAR